MKALQNILCMLFLLLLLANSKAQDSTFIFTYPSAKEVDVLVRANVSEAGNQFTYEYELQSLSSSQQDVWTFRLEYEGNTGNRSAPNGWSVFALRGSNFITWSAADSTSFIPPGGGLTGYRFQSANLPSIKVFYVEGFIELPVLETEPDTIIGGTLIENSKSGKTIGPKPAPIPFSATTFLDTLISYTDQSLALGWIANSLTADKYTNLFSTARSQLVSNDSTGARLTLTTVLLNVAVDSAATFLTSEAIALLRFNTEYLIDQLPAPAGFLIPDLPAALTISSANASAAFAGDNFTITGFNHNMDGTPANDGDDRHGIVTTTAAARQGILNGLQAFRRDNVNGSGGVQADVVQQTLSFNVAAFIDTVLAHIDQTVPVNVAGTFGSAGNPLIVHATQGVQSSANVTGFGILLVDGPLFVSGNFNWTGLIIQRNSPFSGPATSVSTSLKITGGMMVYNTGPWGASLQVSNQLIIRASQEALEMLRVNL